MTSPANDTIAALLAQHARLLEVAGESPFRARAFDRAADILRHYAEPLEPVARRGELTSIPGIGPGIATAIQEILDSGSFAAHDALVRKVPESVVELTTVPGIGAKTAQRLYSDLGIDSLEALDAALQSGAIGATKGLGGRVETTARSGLESLRRRTGRTPLGVALPIARTFEAAYIAARPQDRIQLVGSARRWDVTVGDLDFVIASDDVEATIAALAQSPQLEAQERIAHAAIQCMLPGGIKTDVVIVPPLAWGSALVLGTGSALHLARLGAVPPDVATEEQVYQTFGLPWIPPELRSGEQEFVRWAEIPRLVTISAVNGEFHAHTTWSDGGASIAAMARAAEARGYALLGITDHSHGLGVAGGLTVQRLLEQRRELEEVAAASDITLLAGAEVEVHRNGDLDYDPRTLQQLDVVVASLHSGLRQPRDDLTARLAGVLRNPNVDIIAHPSGRLIERREGGDFAWDRIFPLAAETGTALEINADPARLDLDPSLAERASDAGCLITVNCDAHSPEGFSVMEYGIAMARRAWLKPEQILNCWQPAEILAWLSARGVRP